MCLSREEGRAKSVARASVFSLQDYGCGEEMPVLNYGKSVGCEASGPEQSSGPSNRDGKKKKVGSTGKSMFAVLTGSILSGGGPSFVELRKFSLKTAIYDARVLFCSHSRVRSYLYIYIILLQLRSLEPSQRR